MNAGLGVRIPRAMLIGAVGAFAKVVTALLNRTTVYNADTLLRLVSSRPPGTPLLTVSNHMSTLDDPLMWGFKGFPTMDARLQRWVLAAEDICFKNSLLSYLFRLGKCIPITRGAGIYQQHMNEALQILSRGEWLHSFPEGKVSQERAPIRRLKWGTASLIMRSPVTPIVLPIVHSGFDKVMPEKPFLIWKRPLVPLFNKEVRIIVGEPLHFDVPSLKQTALSVSHKEEEEEEEELRGWPTLQPDGLQEVPQRWLYRTISHKIQCAMERLRTRI
ncbi:N-acylphosphatidylethanolamine synthase-like isoform X1 [Carex littledalei]|uniref:Tafazzin family protein n=1 Tax=Carex littledalei TaxID=544730 RepID=A0A833V7K5_9POAL|nr:N-acylphosphatidylethanolamine synthase-like isoform X1 [Carex littledalei]